MTLRNESGHWLSKLPLFSGPMVSRMRATNCPVELANCNNLLDEANGTIDRLEKDLAIVEKVLSGTPVVFFTDPSTHPMVSTPRSPFLNKHLVYYPSDSRFGGLVSPKCASDPDFAWDFPGVISTSDAALTDVALSGPMSRHAVSSDTWNPHSASSGNYRQGTGFSFAAVYPAGSSRRTFSTVATTEGQPHVWSLATGVTIGALYIQFGIYPAVSGARLNGCQYRPSNPIAGSASYRVEATVGGVTRSSETLSITFS